MFKTSNPLAVHASPSQLPKEFSLKQNYPNPFNPTTSIQYSIFSKQYVSLKVYNALGQEIITLVSQEQSAGTYSVDFNAANLPSGVYIYRLNSGKYFDEKKMLLLK